MLDTRNTTEKIKKAKVYWEPTHTEKILNCSQRFFD